MEFHWTPGALSGLWVIDVDGVADARGMFWETFRADQFLDRGLPPFVQDNRSWSRRGVLRGLHYQLPPAAQGKLVQCVYGTVWDVAVDLRPDSPTYGRWTAVELSGTSGRLVYIPEAMAHGFVVTSSEAVVVYKVTRPYAPEAERGLVWNDPTLAIPWPIKEPIVSEKDQRWPRWETARVEIEAHAATRKDHGT
jgi:dTDP-4-dehydrorhamnose 3,5-epimerase